MLLLLPTMGNNLIKRVYKNVYIINHKYMYIYIYISTLPLSKSDFLKIFSPLYFYALKDQAFFFFLPNSPLKLRTNQSYYPYFGDNRYFLQSRSRESGILCTKGMGFIHSFIYFHCCNTVFFCSCDILQIVNFQTIT